MQKAFSPKYRLWASGRDLPGLQGLAQSALPARDGAARSRQPVRATSAGAAPNGADHTDPGPNAGGGQHLICALAPCPGPAPPCHRRLPAYGQTFDVKDQVGVDRADGGDQAAASVSVTITKWPSLTSR